MYSCRFLKQVLIPAAALVAEEKYQQDAQKRNLCRPSDLPIYVPDPPPVPKDAEPTVPSYLENGFATVREQVTNVYKEVKAYQRVGMDYLEQSKDNAEWLLKYLRQEDNTTPKAGAIAIGGLTGFIFGLRGRFFKRTLYTATGALGMAAVCYPKEASEYSQIAIAEARKYAVIAYNFAYGGGEMEKQVTETASSVVSAQELTEADAQLIVSKTHETTSQSCHCPIGACLGHHDENNAP
ncbi:MICOS complex subunit MIC27 isoform X2 [Tribolium madens]|uniref:MICOS complex subunit MIC27 isoform X2 n=1 Tax=Tribolium madens TaxID=41895 RepID=UPI001CF73933|nr:MICOS complex subunit MIC27 isoform X2 [Tribolium madens]